MFIIYSWGDLFVFAGTAAIIQGGGPVTTICAGRIDNVNGELSDPLLIIQHVIQMVIVKNH